MWKHKHSITYKHIHLKYSVKHEFSVCRYIYIRNCTLTFGKLQESSIRKCLDDCAHHIQFDTWVLSHWSTVVCYSEDYSHLAKLILLDTFSKKRKKNAYELVCQQKEL